MQSALEAAGIPVWRDTGYLRPGEDWRTKIRQAISGSSLVFIACFSRQALSREATYQREELQLAIDQLRQRRPDDPWLIPVRLDDCEIPDWDIGPGRTLTSIHRADVFGRGRDEGIARLVAMILQILGQDSGISACESAIPTPTDVLEWEDNVKEIMNLIVDSKEVWLWGAALTEHIPMLSGTLNRGTSKGLKARILLIEPNSASVNMLVSRAVKPPSSSSESSASDYVARLDEMATHLNRKLMGNLEDLERMRRSVPDGTIEYRAIDYLAPYVLYAFDPTSPEGRLIVRMGFHAGSNEERPTLWFSKQKDAKWFAHFMHQVETVWTAAAAATQAGGWSASWPSARGS